MITWISDLGAIGIAGCVALGLLTEGPHHSYGPCPACGATVRSESSTTDRRLPLYAQRGMGWWCARCEERGDAADLVALRVIGTKIRGLTSEQRAELRRWLVDRTAIVDVPVRPAQAPKPPEYPGDAATMWSTAWDLTGPASSADAEVLAYLERRAGAPRQVIADTGLCRVTRLGAQRPPWWPYSNDWRILFGLYDSHGEVRSVLSRTHVAATAARMGKERPPIGYSRSGLLVADRFGVEVLRGRAAGGMIWLVEGPTAALRLACVMRQAGTPDPVLGGFSGSWSALADVQWPRGCTVVIATDDDQAGHAHAAEARRHLPGLVRATRLHWRATATPERICV